MKSNRFVRLAGALIAPLLVAGAVVAQAGAASAAADWHGGKVLYVSQGAKPDNSDRSCGSAAFRTIQSAVNAAPAGGTVVVCSGTYHEQVVISKPLSLVGQRATIDETGVSPTFQVTLPVFGTQIIFAAVIIVSSHVTFTGFTVTNAQGEGVLAAGLGGTLRDIVIARNAGCTTTSAAASRPRRSTSCARPWGRFPVTAARAFTSLVSPTRRSAATSSPITPAGSC